MAKKRMLADVLWEAANVHLKTDGYRPGDAELWSCNAALLAEFPKEAHRIFTRTGIKSLRSRSVSSMFLEGLGCPVTSDNAFGFGDVSYESAQGVRYIWLLLAMHVAEDEGLTV